MSPWTSTLAWDFSRAVYTIHSPECEWQFSFVRASVPGSKRMDVVPIECPWAIITAWNPMGKPCDRASNVLRQHELERLVHERGLSSYPTVNCSPEGRWPEPGQLVLGIDRAGALSLARQFQQLAIIFACDHRTGLLDCRTERWTVRGVFARTDCSQSLDPPCQG